LDRGDSREQFWPGLSGSHSGLSEASGLILESSFPGMKSPNNVRKTEEQKNTKISLLSPY